MITLNLRDCSPSTRLAGRVRGLRCSCGPTGVCLYRCDRNIPWRLGGRCRSAGQANTDGAGQLPVSFLEFRGRARGSLSNGQISARPGPSLLQQEAEYARCPARSWSAGGGGRFGTEDTAAGNQRCRRKLMTTRPHTDSLHDRARSPVHWWRLAGLCGLGWFALFAVGAIIIQDEPSAYNAPLAEVRQFFTDNSTRFLIGDYLAVLAFLLLFLPFAVGHWQSSWCRPRSACCGAPIRPRWRACPRPASHRGVSHQARRYGLDRTTMWPDNA